MLASRLVATMTLPACPCVQRQIDGEYNHHYHCFITHILAIASIEASDLVVVAIARQAVSVAIEAMRILFRPSVGLKKSWASY